MAKTNATTPTVYLERWLEDADVRQNLLRATEATRRAYLEATGRQPAAKAARHARLQRRVRDAVLSLGRAGAAAREAERKRQRAQRQRRTALLVLIGASVAAGAAARSKTGQAPGDGSSSTNYTYQPPPPPEATAEASPWR